MLRSTAEVGVPSTMPRTSASLVVYNSVPGDLQELLVQLGECAALATWVVVDNSASERPNASEELKAAVEFHGGCYVAAPRNLGFGAGHNLALKTLNDRQTEFHVMVNPDILFGTNVMIALEQAMDEHSRTVLMMPRVVYPDGAPQHLCKLLPTPFDFALRRFFPQSLQRFFQGQLDRYEMRGLADTPCDRVPFLSGCFMFTRRKALESIGGFDDRFFLYLEDVDLCRRMADVGNLLYWPSVKVVHGCYRGAYRHTRLMFVFLQSAARYFHKWGWFFDKKRRRANRAALACLPGNRS